MKCWKKWIKNSKIKSFGSGKKNRKRKELNCQIFAPPPSTSTIHLHRPFSFPPPSFVLSLLGGRQTPFPHFFCFITTLLPKNKRERKGSAEEEKRATFLSWNPLFIVMFSFQNQCRWVVISWISCVILVFGVETTVLKQISLVLDSFPNLSFCLVMVDAWFWYKFSCSIIRCW